MVSPPSQPSHTTATDDAFDCWHNIDHILFGASLWRNVRAHALRPRLTARRRSAGQRQPTIHAEQSQVYRTRSTSVVTRRTKYRKVQKFICSANRLMRAIYRCRAAAVSGRSNELWNASLTRYLYLLEEFAQAKPCAKPTFSCPKEEPGSYGRKLYVVVWTAVLQGLRTPLLHN
jgi:hypothetical protein